MVIPEYLLKRYKVNFLNCEKDDYIFYEDDPPNFYFQVLSGSNKMSSYSTAGQEFIQGVFQKGESFGEPTIFGNFNYPNNAITIEKSVIVKIPGDRFL